MPEAKPFTPKPLAFTSCDAPQRSLARQKLRRESEPSPEGDTSIPAPARVHPRPPRACVPAPACRPSHEERDTCLWMERGTPVLVQVTYLVDVPQAKFGQSEGRFPQTVAPQPKIFLTRFFANLRLLNPSGDKGRLEH